MHSSLYHLQGNQYLCICVINDCWATVRAPRERLRCPLRLQDTCCENLDRPLAEKRALPHACNSHCAACADHHQVQGSCPSPAVHRVQMQHDPANYQPARLALCLDRALHEMQGKTWWPAAKIGIKLRSKQKCVCDPGTPDQQTSARSRTHRDSSHTRESHPRP